METGQLYETYRPLLFSIAYRLLGSVTDAEDTVQETFMVWSERIIRDSAVVAPVHNEKAFLCRVITNLCADRIRKESRRRETYIGPWLPEPLIEDFGGPEDICVRKETIHTAYLLLLQQLSAIERTVFVLREAFDFSYDEIAEITGKSTANCRQIFRRSKRGIPALEPDPQPAPQTDNEQLRSILLEFAQSLERGDIGRVLQLLKSDAVLLSDGGGKVKAALNPIHSSERIIAFVAGTAAKLPSNTEISFRIVNGLPGLVYKIGGIVHYAVSLAFKGGQITSIYMVSNPDKLVHLNQAD
ncbi:RNA polymerase sigma factor SigJ [Paenibacillus sp. sptzw28]|uniref:RNA polymerase sigma factor SigJ n=1 Tax=Paenibacillus sp. sptzw28 TaxID=715179 RepID=UPI001C6E19CD|nr:RNA polymerase sigma factor SigJ [Paenibacillus sp. sptzw28]QYR23579.1 RNA polymerase sigma factor SigJ [Paenibacillus sp. sptzw28]